MNSETIEVLRFVKPRLLQRRTVIAAFVLFALSASTSWSQVVSPPGEHPSTSHMGFGNAIPKRLPVPVEEDDMAAPPRRPATPLLHRPLRSVIVKRKRIFDVQPPVLHRLLRNRHHLNYRHRRRHHHKGYNWWRWYYSTHSRMLRHRHHHFLHLSHRKPWTKPLALRRPYRPKRVKSSHMGVGT
jgi:hypothetical protein